MALDSLQAEAHALVLASAINKSLQIRQVKYLTDSMLLAANLQKQDPVTQAADWRIRPLLADFICNSKASVTTISKIPRLRNNIAHTLAAQARTQAALQACLFSCNNVSHSSGCAVKLALQDINWGVYRLISVTYL
ncbi:unnamed protein product [Urochloa humidicola]